MGKRKSAAKPQGPKKREGLATSFQCLFCNHENAVTVKLDKKTSTGELTCKVCGQTYQTTINCKYTPFDPVWRGTRGAGQAVEQKRVQR
ncbi:Elf1-domain-containing protein [Myriangium duriaei CBS 260.36]|uniref:Transcription elongation factor 1 homolog n=1 Tax=Myriangium duriaei CBS 260.36 TaxID=1168546 RepID=A0A9P4MEE8_9PEZI|nr:Elf1-domain-containing protein [Myriangium duriaei CBS 260.36]